MEGLREGMADRLVVGSKQWEKKELAEVAKAIKAGNMSHKRQYPLTVAATMAYEQLFYQRLRHIGVRCNVATDSKRISNSCLSMHKFQNVFTMWVCH